MSALSLHNAAALSLSDAQPPCANPVAAADVFAEFRNPFPRAVRRFKCGKHLPGASAISSRLIFQFP